jgi:SAM-dependent methyltransferase
VRGWFGLYRTSVGLGVRHLLRKGYLREAVVRIVVPLWPTRYLELPWALRALAASPDERLLDLGSSKLLAVALARRGVHVTTVDELTSEIERWRALTEGEPTLEFLVADGRALPFPEASFDHATSISVLEHVTGDRGDAEALSELARCVRPGGRVLITLPYSRSAWIEYRNAPVYVDHGPADEVGEMFFFQRWYDDEAVKRLIAAVPALALQDCSVVRMTPNWKRIFPWLIFLGPLYGLLGRERTGPGGEVVRLLLTRR